MGRSKIKITLAVALLLVAGWAGANDATGLQTLGPGADPLRADFNSATGRVRAILLVSPT